MLYSQEAPTSSVKNRQVQLSGEQFTEPAAKDFEPSVEKTAFLFERTRNDIAWMSELSGISKSTLYKLKNDGKASQKTIEKLSQVVDTYFYIDYLKR